MAKIFRILNRYMGNRAYIIGPLLVLCGAQFSTEKSVAVAFVFSGMLLVVTRPFVALGKDKSAK
ncbi:hypothetical protein OKZ62_001769 [Vibrio navarrensis]|nr:hypothetical protein [Vibrio navarrensis]